MKRMVIWILAITCMMTIFVSVPLNVDAATTTVQAESASFISRSDGVWLWPTSYYAVSDWAGCNASPTVNSYCYFCGVQHGLCGANHVTTLGHNGVDIPVGAGSNVYAAAAGTLYCTNYDWPDRGITAVVEHPISGTGWSYYTVYQHLQTAYTAKNDTAVAAGEVIALSGSTDGYGTGQAHLHFGILMGASGQGNALAQDPNNNISAIEKCGWITTSGYAPGRILPNPALNSPAGNPTYTDGCESNVRTHAGSVMYTLNASEVAIGEPSAVCSHSYTVAETPAGCTKDGIRQYTCSLCGDSYLESIAALGHSYGEWVVETGASCTQAGTETKTCSACGDVVSQEIPTIGHSYSGEQMEAACGDYPKTRYTCQNCGDHYDEYGDDIYSDWVTELPDGADAVQTKTEYRYQTMLTATGTESTMDGWTFLDTTYGDWGSAQTTSSRPTESDTLRITATTQIAWGYYHWCNYYYNGGNNWNVDSIAYGSSCTWHGYTSTVELPAVAISDQGGQQAYGGTGTAACPCAYNFYIWFRNTGADVYTYTYQTRELLNRFYKWTEWSDWSEDPVSEDEQTNVETRTLYRYITAEKGEHQYSSVEISPTFTKPGSITHTCALCSDVIVEDIPCLKGNVDQWNILLDDDLKVNYLLDISQSIEATAKVKITVGEDTVSYKVSELSKTDDGLYQATVSVSAAQMNDAIMVVVMNGSQIGSTNTYTVRQYADTVLADESLSRYHAMVKEMLNYGGAAQIYFDYETDCLANDGITDVGTADIPDVAEVEMSVSGKADGISFYAASLVFRDKIAVRFYFKADKDINAYTFTRGELCYTPVLKNGYYYVEVAGITPENLDQQLEMTVTDTDGNTLTVCYSPMNYMVRMNEKGGDSLKALLKALYNYHLAAKALRTETE